MDEENSITKELLPKNLSLYFADSLEQSFKTINKDFPEILKELKLIQ